MIFVEWLKNLIGEAKVSIQKPREDIASTSPNPDVSEGQDSENSNVPVVPESLQDFVSTAPNPDVFENQDSENPNVTVVPENLQDFVSTAPKSDVSEDQDSENSNVPVVSEDLQDFVSTAPKSDVSEDQNSENSNVPVVPEHLRTKHPWLTTLMMLMGGLVVYFNVKGYDILFADESMFGFIPISPFGLLLGVAELAVLSWTSTVIKDWRNTSKILKGATVFLIPCFAFLCYSGINSYLNTLATADIAKAEEARQIKINNSEYIKGLEKESSQTAAIIEQQNDKIIQTIEQVQLKNIQIKDLYEQASERRLTATNCSKVADCANSVAAFTSQAELLEHEIEELTKSRSLADQRVAKYENELSEIQSQLRNEKKRDRNTVNEHAGTESSYQLKKASYEAIVLTVAGWFNYKPESPFSIFIGFLSALIYPVYFLLNLFLSLNSEQNIKYREESRKKKAEKNELRRIKRESVEKEKSLERKARNILIKALIKFIKLDIRKRQQIRRERNRIETSDHKTINNTGLIRKLIKYFRVWAARRQKIIKKTTFVDQIVEIEIEKEVTRYVDRVVEVDKQVPVYVDKVVKVNNEIPVFIEKITKVSEPMVIKEPQVIIHERLLPVPENISAIELQAIFDAEYRSKTSTLPQSPEAIKNMRTDSGDTTVTEGREFERSESERFEVA